MDQDRANKIKALLVKGNDPAATEAERELYQDKAADLMAKWQIDEAMLAHDQRVVTDTIVKRPVKLDAPKIYLDEVVHVGGSVAAGFGLTPLRIMDYVKGPDGHYVVRGGKIVGTPRVLLIGFTADLDVIEQVIQLVHTQLMTAWNAYGASLPRYYSASQKYNMKRSFLMGFSSRIEERIRDSRKRTIAEITETHGTGTELVLLDREAQVTLWINENLKLGVTKAKRYVSSGMHEGMNAANNTNIGQTRVGAARRALGN